MNGITQNGCALCVAVERDQSRPGARNTRGVRAGARQGLDCQHGSDSPCEHGSRASGGLGGLPTAHHGLTAVNRCQQGAGEGENGGITYSFWVIFPCSNFFLRMDSSDGGMLRSS